VFGQWDLVIGRIVFFEVALDMSFGGQCFDDAMLAIAGMEAESPIRRYPVAGWSGTSNVVEP